MLDQSLRLALISVVVCGLVLHGQAKSTVTVVDATVQQWCIAELTLTSNKTYANPFTDVDVDATFTGPGGLIISRPVFWDGGNTWKIRFAAPVAGTWTFTTIATDTSDTGLDNRRGIVTVAAYTGGLLVYQHGFVKSIPGHYLTYQDGTPFWWMGNDMTLVDLGHLNNSNKSNWNPVPAHPTSQILGSIDQWVTQQFNVITFAFFNHWAKGTTPGTKINLERFANFYDPVVSYATSQGMTVVLILGYNNINTVDGLDANKSYARYLVARYGAYPLVWSVAEPDTPPGVNGVPDASYAKTWENVLAYTASLDGYHHPIGPWYRQTALGQTPTLYLGTKWVNLIISQCGHLKAPADYSLGGQQLISVYNFYYNNYPQIPMIEAGGCNYVNIFPDVTDYVARRSAWRAVLSGSAGFGFGENGMWNMQWDATGSNSGGEGQVTPWYLGIDAPSGWQMCFLRSFYAALPWWRMVPFNGLTKTVVSWNAAISLNDISTPSVSGDSGLKNVVIYLPQEFSSSGPIGIIHGLSPLVYIARWYNPRTGASSSAKNVVPDRNADWTIPHKPDDNDWVLLLKATSKHQ